MDEKTMDKKDTSKEKLEEKKEAKKPYSWGPLYETLQEMIQNGDELPDEGLKRGFELFHKLDNSKGIVNIYNVLKEVALTENERLRLCSPCLDGIIASIDRLNGYTYAILNTCTDTCIYYIENAYMGFHRFICITGKHLLLKHIIEKNEPIDTLQKCMKEACRYVHLEIIKLLTDYIIDKKPADGQLACTIGLKWLTFVTRSVTGNHCYFAEMLINAGADVNYNNSEPLKHAYNNRNIPMMKFLIENGAKTFPYVETFLKEVKIDPKDPMFQRKIE